MFALLGAIFLALRLFLSRRRVDGFVKWSARVLVWLIGIRVRVEGVERLDREGAYAFLFNHLTALDHFVFYGVLPHFGRGLEAVENFRIPVYGLLMRAAGNYPIDRRNPAAARATLEACARDCREQAFSVFCAPEGTRSRDGSLGRFRRGVFELALACGREIAPIVLVGLHPVLPPGEWRVVPGEVTVRVLQPIGLTGATGEPLTITELRDRVRDAFLENLGGE